MFRATRATIVVSVLDRVVGLAERSQHAIGDCPQARPMIFELGGEPFLLIHVTFPFPEVSPE